MQVFDSAAQGADFEEVRFIQDRATGLRAMLAVHDTQRGPAFGGIRRRRYPDEATAFDDARRLAEGMSLKLALADLPAGGAKTVILDDGALKAVDVRRRYEALGRAIDGMGGRYVCGPDVGTGEEHLDAVRTATRWVNPKGNDANAATAAGVLAGIRGILGHMGTARQDASFVVQGLGGVGLAVAQALRAGGGDVRGADPSPDAQQRARQTGIGLVDPAAVLQAPCDVFVPCALGGVLTDATVEVLRAKAVCGSANNQLATPSVDEALRQRGILYAPDFAVNVGAVAEGVMTMRRGATDEVRMEALKHIKRVEATVREILRQAEGRHAGTQAVALRMARGRLGR